MKYFNKKNCGFTLPEVLVYMAIFVSVFVLGANYIITGFKTSRFASEQETAIQYARKATEIMAKELRGANSSEQGAYPLDTTEAENLFTYYDSNNATSTSINSIRLIKTSIKINVTPGIAPNDYYVETSVQLRNLKDNL